MTKTRSDLESEHVHGVNLALNEVYNPEVVFLIPVYNTEPEILKNTVVDLYNKICRRTTIVIVDDGSYKRETKDALKELEKLEEVTVIRSNENRGKVRALLLGLEYIKEKFRGARCVFILDDDVLIRLPYSKNKENLYEVIVRECRCLNDVVSVVTFPARSQSLSSYIEKLQDMEHLLSTHLMRLHLQKVFHSKIITESGIVNDPEFVEGIWVNGSGSLWLIDELRRVLEEHSGEHDGDDLEMTLIFRRHGKIIKFSDKIILYPKLKSRINKYFKQRIHWSRGALRLLFAHPNEVLLHYTYLLYVLAPIFLYLDIADVLFENLIVGTFLPKLFFDTIGIIVLITSMASFLRTIKFFEDVGKDRMAEGSLAKKLATYARILKQCFRTMKSECVIPILLFVVLLLRGQIEQILSNLIPIVYLVEPCINTSMYFVFLFASMYFTYKLLTEYRYRLCYVYDEYFCKPLRKTTLLTNVTAYSIYILFYILVVMPIGYLYSMIRMDFLKLNKFLSNSSCEQDT